MKLSDSLFASLNRQYLTELGNYGMYQALANIAGNASWAGFETFFKEYALDEVTHAQKIADYIISRNHTPLIDTLQNPKVGNPSIPVEWVQVAYDKALAYTALIKQNYEQSLKEGDIGAGIFLQWYVSEQERVELVLYDLKTELGRAQSNAAVLIIDARYRK